MKFRRRVNEYWAMPYDGSVKSAASIIAVLDPKEDHLGIRLWGSREYLTFVRQDEPIFCGEWVVKDIGTDEFFSVSDHLFHKLFEPTAESMKKGTD